MYSSLGKSYSLLTTATRKSVFANYSIALIVRTTNELNNNQLDLDNTVIVTKNCARRIKNLQEKSRNESLYLRLAVEGGGCSGFKYTFKMEDAPIDKDEDTIFERDGARVIVDQSSFELVRGATVDYVEEMMRSAFTVSSNPQSENACGCGSSFALKNFAANPARD